MCCPVGPFCCFGNGFKEEREEKCKRLFPASKSKCKKLHEIHWDGYQYQDRLREWGERGLWEEKDDWRSSFCSHNQIWRSSFCGHN
jgi:hypothetical protein